MSTSSFRSMLRLVGRSHRDTRLVSILCALAIGVPLGVSAPHASFAGSLASLGPPTDAIFSVGPFHASFKGAPRLIHDGKPELLLVGAINDAEPGAERWALVKALSQFGSFTNLSTIETGGEEYGNHDPTWQIYTYDWRKATYHSRYIALVHDDDISATPGPHGHYINLPKQGKRLANKYWRLCVNCLGAVMQIGDYYRIAVNLTPGEFQDANSNPLPFSTIQETIRKGYSPHYSALAFDVDAETNTLTALICHADGKKPASVCGRKVIKELLKHLK